MKILEREIVYGMQLLGASSVRDLVPEMVSPVVSPRRRQKQANLASGRTGQLATRITYASQTVDGLLKYHILMLIYRPFCREQIINDKFEFAERRSRSPVCFVIDFEVTPLPH